MWFDVTRYIIPNWLVGSLIAVYLLAVILGHGHADWKMGLAAMLIVFAIGYVLFARKWMGGGDIKLLTACSLWIGLHDLLDFLFLVSMLGGIFAGGLWGVRKFDYALPKMGDKGLPRILRQGEPVPYGVAIALGFIIMIYLGRITALS